MESGHPTWIPELRVYKNVSVSSLTVPLAVDKSPHILASVGPLGGGLCLSLELASGTSTAPDPLTPLVGNAREVQSLQCRLLVGRADGEGCGEQAIFRVHTRALV